MSNKTIISLEPHIKQQSLEDGVGTSNVLSRLAGTEDMDWFGMIIACRKVIQERVDFVNSCAEMNKSNLLYANKVNAIWDLLKEAIEKAKDIEEFKAMNFSERYEGIQSMPDPFWHTSGKRAIDEFCPYYISQQNVVCRERPAYQRFLWYLTDGAEGLSPEGILM